MIKAKESLKVARKAVGGPPSIMWEGKDNLIVLLAELLASHQAYVSGRQRNSSSR